jgi:uncharacterized membrane protein HdeD (DUF308 family)
MDRRHGWLLALRGVAAIVFGVLAVIWPGVTIVALAILFGVFALVNGVILFVVAFRRRYDASRRVAHILLGLLNVGAGVVALLWPSITALVLVLVIGAWAVVSGVVDIWMAAVARGQWLMMILGIVSIAAGVLILLRPDIGAVSLAIVLGVYAMIAGVLMLVEVWRERRSAAPAGHPAVPAGG